MSDVRMDSDTLQSRVLFGCGIVLGVCLGFGAGHVTIWSRVAPKAGEENPFAALEAASDSLFTPSDSNFSEKATTPVASQQEGAPGPFYAEAARPLLRSTDGPTSSPQRVRVATETLLPTEEPDALPPSSAAPIDDETQLREQVTRTIIAQEMPHATADEQEIWFDVLRGMEAADVKGILRMRKHVGDDPSTSLGLLRPEPEVATVAPPRRLKTDTSTDDQAWTRTLQSLQRIRDVHLHNLANAETIGFIRQIPVTREADYASGERGCELVRVESDHVPCEPRSTGRMLDIAVYGNGFFQVSHNSDINLTRSGRLRINEHRQLELATTSQPWRIDPEIVVPEEVTVIRFQQNGDVMGAAGHDAEMTVLGTISLVTVDQPELLHAVGDGMHKATDESGGIRPAGVEEVRLDGQSLLLLTTAQIDEEMERLDRVTRLIDELSRRDRSQP